MNLKKYILAFGLILAPALALAGTLQLMGVGPGVIAGAPPADCTLGNSINNNVNVQGVDGLNYTSQSGNVSGSKPWALRQWSCNNGYRFEVRSGDKPSFDAADVERSEVSGTTTYAITGGVSAEIWCAWSERVLNPPGLASSLFKTSPQAHHSGNTGNPPWSLNYTQSNSYQVIGRTNTGGPSGTATTYYTLAGGPAMNTWHDYVVRLKFNYSGTCSNCGIMQVWIDQANVVNRAPANDPNWPGTGGINLGYTTSMSPAYMKWGIYRGSSSQVTIKDYANWECATDTNALGARVTTPRQVDIP